MIKVVGLGAGGHARAVVDLLQIAGGVELIGLLTADATQVGSTVLGVPVLGGEQLLPALRAQGVHHAFVGVGSTTRPESRVRIYQMLCDAGFALVSAVHPSAVVARSASLGNGVTIMANAVVGPAARIGDNVLVNSGAIVEHDCRVDNHCHIAPGAVLAGGVRIGSCSHIGLGARVIENLSVGANSIVGAGAVVVADVGDDVVVVGVPARVLQGTRSARRSTIAGEGSGGPGP